MMPLKNGGLPLAVCDQISFLKKLAIAVLFSPAGIGVRGIARAHSIIRHEQIPLPGARIFRKTRVRRGRAVRYQGYALVALSIVLMLSPIVTWRVIAPIFRDLSTGGQCSTVVSMHLYDLRSSVRTYVLD
jgi:hypothetical protein